MNKIKMFTQKIYSIEGMRKENYIHIEGFINNYLKDLKIETLLKNTDTFREVAAVIDEIIEQLKIADEEANAID